MYRERNTNSESALSLTENGCVVDFLKNKAPLKEPEVINKVTLVKISLGNCYENVNIWHSYHTMEKDASKRTEMKDAVTIKLNKVILRLFKIIRNRFPFVYSELLPNTSALSYEAKCTDLENIGSLAHIVSIQYIVLS